MTMTARLKTLSALLLAMAVALPGLRAHAEVDSFRLYLAARGDIPWQSLSPEEQRALQRHRGNWDDYRSSDSSSLRARASRSMARHST